MEIYFFIDILKLKMVKFQLILFKRNKNIPLILISKEIQNGLKLGTYNYELFGQTKY